LLPETSQLSHWSENEGAGVPDHVPGLAVSVLPTAGVPWIVGSEVAAGLVPLGSGCDDPGQPVVVRALVIAR